jgi:D-3-phosphoglycerate dehydrogenase
MGDKPVMHIVHTGADQNTPCTEETRILDRPDIRFLKRGRCSTEGQLLAALRDADVAICWDEPYTRDVLAELPRLKGVIRCGVGVDTVDLEAATDYGVIVANFPDFCIREVANHAVVLMMACAKRIVQMDHALRTQGWDASRALRIPMGAIHGETLGLIAFGNIAQATAERAGCLEMNVIAFDPYVDEAVFEEYGVESVGLEELAARSDYVSCHVPLNTETIGLIDAAFFSAMKPTAYFINTSRGAVVVEADLITALLEKRIAGAGLDVYESEPLGPDHPLIQMDNVALTPHTASYADETFRARDRRVALTAITILEGGVPEFVANPEVLGHRRT